MDALCVGRLRLMMMPSMAVDTLAALSVAMSSFMVVRHPHKRGIPTKALGY